MRHILLSAISLAFVFACAAQDLEKYAVWVTGEVVNDAKDGLMFRADKPVKGNTTANLVFLAVTEQTSKVLAPMYYQAAEKHVKLRLYGAFLPSSRPEDPNRPSINFLTWKLHLPSDPDELPSSQKIIIGPDKAVPGYTIIPRKP